MCIRDSTYSDECDEAVRKIANIGGTPLVVAKDDSILGVIYLKDIIKSGVKEKFADPVSYTHLCPCFI